MAEHVHIVFDGPPGPEGNRFIEVEDASGRSIAFGEWIERKDLLATLLHRFKVDCLRLVATFPEGVKLLAWPSA